MGPHQPQARLTTTLVLDSGALIALDCGDDRTWAALHAATRRLHKVQVPVGALAQAWRGGPRQARLARALKKCDEAPLDGQTARELGELCGRSGTDDVIDASVAVAAARASRQGPVSVLTSDRADIVLLLVALNAAADVVDV